VGRDFELALGAEAYSQTQICRIEKLDITPGQAKALEPVLRQWLAIADQRYCIKTPQGQWMPLVVNKFVANNTSAGKKRKARTSFSADTVAKLKERFAANATPNTFQVQEMAEEFGLNAETVRNWFSNKRQHVKKTS